ncbi:MAG: Sec-independent protein translocase subunit TatA/TatB [Bacillota bacterium]
MFGIGPWELILILAIALVIFGPGKLPEVGKALGNGLKEFRKASENIKEEVRKEAAEVK